MSLREVLACRENYRRVTTWPINQPKPPDPTIRTRDTFPVTSTLTGTATRVHRRRARWNSPARIIRMRDTSLATWTLMGTAIQPERNRRGRHTPAAQQENRWQKSHLSSFHRESLAAASKRRGGSQALCTARTTAMEGESNASKRNALTTTSSVDPS